jgi:cytochrome b
MSHKLPAEEMSRDQRAADITPPASSTAVLVWDLPVRVAHWSFVILLPALWLTAEYGEMQVHFILGHIALSLLIFRIYWGVVGSSTARFATFVRGPRAILRYLRAGDTAAGHNPLGALSVIALLGLLGLQIGLGLFAQDSDAIHSGPLAGLVSFETSDAATEWHGDIFNILVGLVALHIAAIAFYLLGKKDNLLTPMITGRKRVETLKRSHHPDMGSAVNVLVGAAISAALTVWIGAGFAVS